MSPGSQRRRGGELSATQSPLGWSRLTAGARADWQPPAPTPSWPVKVAAPPPPTPQLERRWRRQRRPGTRRRPRRTPEVGGVSPLAHAPIGRSRCRFVATSTDVGPCCRWPGSRGRRSPASAAASGFQGGKLHVTPLGAHAFLLQHRLMLDLAAGPCCRATNIDCAAPVQALFPM